MNTPGAFSPQRAARARRRVNEVVSIGETISFGEAGICPWNLIDFKDTKRKIPIHLNPIERKL